MRSFRFAALESTSGREVQGEVAAADPAAAAAELRRRALLPIALEEAFARSAAAPAARSGPGFFASLRMTRTRDTVLVLRQLALMLRTGLTILQALDVAQKQCPKPRLAAALGRIRLAVETGSTVSDAFARESRYLPPIASRLVGGAEAAGELDVVLEQIAQHMEARLELRNSLVMTLVYPALVMVVSAAVFLFLVTSVLPKFARFLQRRGSTLPWATQFLLDLNVWIREYGPHLATFVVLALLAFLFARTRPRSRRAIDRAILAVPMLGGLVTASAMAQLGNTLAMLLRGGVSLIESLRLVSGIVMNGAIASQIEKAAEDVLNGQDLASGLRGRTIPLLVGQIVAVGEQTGALDTVLEEVGRFYDAEVRARVKQIAAAFEPIFISVVGGVVGFVYFAFFQALYQLTS